MKAATELRLSPTPEQSESAPFLPLPTPPKEERAFVWSKCYSTSVSTIPLKSIQIKANIIRHTKGQTEKCDLWSKIGESIEADPDDPDVGMAR